MNARQNSAYRPNKALQQKAPLSIFSGIRGFAEMGFLLNAIIKLFTYDH